MIKLSVKEDCCGCGACLQRCPRHCIFFKEDKEGFLYPLVDESNCIDCGLCEKVCPVINRGECNEPLYVYAVKNRNERIRLNSSSGGVFYSLGKYVIQKGGVVFGAAYDDKWEVRHQKAESMDTLEPLMRSKYVQSRIGNTFVEVETFLKQGKLVLFTGTSCQILGLKNFLRHEYENLLTVDVICHGVPSPGVWRKFLMELTHLQSHKTALCEVAGKKTVLLSSPESISAITDINFREKEKYGWEKFGFVVLKKSVSKTGENSVLLSNIFSEDPYSRGFVNNLFMRPSCYACPAKGGTCGSDVTMADFWGIQKLYPDFDDDKGVSLAIIHSLKGADIFNTCNFESMPVTLEEGTRFNQSYYHSMEMTSKRALFFADFIKGKKIRETVMRLTRRPVKMVVKQIIRKIICG